MLPKTLQLRIKKFQVPSKCERSKINMNLLVLYFMATCIIAEIVWPSNQHIFQCSEVEVAH